jgi:hypothetical protein
MIYLSHISSLEPKVFDLADLAIKSSFELVDSMALSTDLKKCKMDIYFKKWREMKV